ncbi:PREDICTED: putative F-box protein At1g12855 [Camelina sativa]|uniref:F-box protein At1g12855 n=1 Tax=Camelina sativa TaxID=90675 RepID=A0ABM0VN77_CAMSA|nr:PREDICTED: putative F-box protein At1g12855 [Camelina sativa]XP_010458725.1 PREDICTED: putative F-box protein At1g12855 [Camelina sativa]
MKKEKQAIASSSQRKRRRILRRNEKLVFASSSQRKSRRRRRRRRRNEKAVFAPSSLPNDVVEEIFLRLPVKALIRLKSLSKQWRWTIESRSFEERHLEIAKRSHLDYPKVMVISEEYPFKGSKGKLPRPDTDIGFSTICLESASVMSSTLITFPQGFLYWTYASESCDGLFCIHSVRTLAIYVVNPATRWLRQLPPARFQTSMLKLNPTPETWSDVKSVCYIAFVKAIDYKLVWMYNSDASSPNEELTKCEVFDFRANTWRYLTCTTSYRLFCDQAPTSANGSIYWFTEPYYGEIKVVALDIHTEKFRVLPKINPAIASSDPNHIDMCTLDNDLCMSKREGDTMIQHIWRLKSSEDSWEKIYTIDLLSCSSSLSEFRDGFNWTQKDLVEPSTPVAICKNKKILLSHRYARNLIKYDPQAKSLCLFFQRPLCRRYVSYFQSLITHV